MKNNVTNENQNTLHFLLRYGVKISAIELWKTMESIRIIFK